MFIAEVWFDMQDRLEDENHRLTVLADDDPQPVERTVNWMRKHLGEYDPEEPAIIPHLGKHYFIRSIEGNTVNVARSDY